IWPNAEPLFYSEQVSENLDFVSVHFYPEKDQIEKAVKALTVYDIGKPLVIEETFPLRCSRDELDSFIDGSKAIVDGWISFYWGKTVEEYAGADLTIADAIKKQWLEHFAAKSKQVLPPHTHDP
ncbi:MAG: hypothetical protein KAR47_00930, partial [Planctomycetes bacterium]|nr:hypothetical protein [Planctomycetota bacterium]